MDEQKYMYWMLVVGVACWNPQILIAYPHSIALHPQFLILNASFSILLPQISLIQPRFSIFNSSSSLLSQKNGIFDSKSPQISLISDKMSASAAFTTCSFFQVCQIHCLPISSLTSVFPAFLIFFHFPYIYFFFIS